MTNVAKIISRQRRVRLHIKSVGSRPRLSVTRSNLHITASIIDDSKHITVTTVTDVKIKGTKTEKSIAVGKLIAEASLKSGIKQVVFDRGSYRYHGRVKALAESARSNGLEF
ncbi:MAG: 50S ribosomal protein L18 [bacterium]